MPEPRRLSALDVSRCSELIHDRSGLDFPHSRLADLEQVIADTLASTGLGDVDALLALLADGNAGEAVLHEMIVDLTVNETYFFRNQPQCHALEHHILPQLIAQRRQSRHLRIWSAGCATGEEAYSLAILLERMLPDLADWNIHLLATDINSEVLAKAEQGCYGEWSFRHVAPEIKDAYFTPKGAELEILPRLRARVTFARHNLAEDAFPSFLTQTHDMDLILCRNVLIYFRQETVRRIVDQFGRSLNEGGWLIVGHSEPSQLIFGQFATRNFPGTVVYQKSGVRNQGSGIRSQESGVRGQESGARGQESGVRNQESAVNRQNARGANREAQAHALPYTGDRSAYEKAKALADRMQWAEAEQWITAALARDPLLAAGHYLRALILLERAQPEAALTALRSCVFADGDFVMGHVALADLLARQGQPERARKALETAGRLAGKRPAHELIPEGDGLTAGRLLEMVHRRMQSP